MRSLLFRSRVLTLSAVLSFALALVLSACIGESAEETSAPAPTASQTGVAATTEPAPTASPTQQAAATEPAPTERPATEPTPTEAPEIQAFEDQLMQALEGRDYAGLQGLMGDSFMIAAWRSEGAAHTPDAAIEQLRNNYLGQGTALAFDPDEDLRALLDGADPLNILGPNVMDPRAMYVSGWGAQGQDEAILYIAHATDGIPFWYGVLVASGGFAPVTSEPPPGVGDGAVIAIPEASVAVRLPPGQMLVKNGELFRRGSYAAYDFVQPTDLSYPYLAEIQFFTRDSIEGFESRCDPNTPCFYGDYPDVERYDGQKSALAVSQDFDGFALQTIGDRPYFVSEHRCEGALCVVREYTTFFGDIKVDVWVMMDANADSESRAAQADALFSQIQVQGDWAGIGAQPGPLFVLLDPGVTLRHPLNWVVREEAGPEGGFVAHSVSFVPPEFAASDQPQVPSIDLFVYEEPLTDTLADWLDAHSTAEPFGSESPPDTFFFRVQGPAVDKLRGGGPPALQFTHDVMGMMAYETLVAVGQSVVGLSTVDFAGQNLLPAYLQVKSSLLPASAYEPAEETPVKSVVAQADVAMYRGPGEAYQQIGQVFGGQVALVTGASEDGAWWRVICPNDAIGDCWVSADVGSTMPNDPPGTSVDPDLVSTWSEYRDERYGYGLAVPCHWLIVPTPPQGNYATLTVRSYDENFRLQNSVKGEWKDGRWPTGAIKMDVTVVEGVSPEQALADVVAEVLGQSEFVMVEGVEDVRVGTHDAVVATIIREDNPVDRHTTYGLRLEPDKVIMLSVLPEDAWRSGDAQGILQSIALSGDEAAAVPSYPPAPALMAVPEDCVD